MSAIGIANPLFFIGIVEDIVDPRFEGRVKVRVFGVHGDNQDVPKDDLPWAIVCRGDYDPSNWIPRENSWVFGLFLDGREGQNPMVLGLIPTTNNGVNPEGDGHGTIPSGDPNAGSRTAAGSTPEDVGQPRMHRLARGENVEETYVLSQEMNRDTEIKVAVGEGENETTLEEPNTAYNTRYPHNRVISTACHSIEMDDTPGSERIMIHHKDGSFYQISAGGLVVEKASGNKWRITDENEVQVIKGQSTVTIKGDARIRIEGNKIEEIMGDYQQIVHGNSYITSGGQMTINASEQAQMRAADIRLDANVGTFSFYSGKEIQIESGIGTYFKSPFIWMEAPSNMNIKANNINMTSIADLNLRSNGNMNVETLGNLNIKGDNLYIGAESDGNLYGTATLQVGTGGQLSLYGDTVAIDDEISMANGDADPASFPDGAVFAESSISANRVEAPEPPAKGQAMRPSPSDASGKPHGGVTGASGYASGDDEAEGGPGTRSGGGGNNNNGGSGSSGNTYAPLATSTLGLLGPLLDVIGSVEGDGAGGYDAIWGGSGRPNASATEYVPTGRNQGISIVDYPSKPLTQLTIQEVLDWQESIDARYNSEASGRYQFMEDTLRGYNNDGNARPRPSLAERAGISLSARFNPENQDKMAAVLLQGAGLNSFLAGTKSVGAFGNSIAGIWAGVPQISGPNAGRGRYDGDGLNQAKADLVPVLTRVLEELKANYDRTGSLESVPEPTSTGPSSRGGRRAWTSEDAENVEQLRSFNTDIGGGEARSRLTPGERAYAISRGYIRNTGVPSTTPSSPNRPGENN